MKTWGLPYKGSKSKIVDQVVGVFPKRHHLYDLFCGGGSITHFAMTTHKFNEVHMNDINWMCPTLFRDVLEGKYDNEERWISRDEFNELKDKDPYVAFIWSFGNNLRDYLYGKDVEPLKKALHHVLFWQDNTYAKELGYDMEAICSIDTQESRYKAIKQYFRGG